MHINDNHWIVSIYKEKKLIMYDSMGNENLKISRKLCDLLESKLKVENIEIASLKTKIQNNTYDCGIFSMLFMLAEAGNLSVDINQEHATEYRFIIKNILLEQINFNKRELERYFFSLI